MALSDTSAKVREIYFGRLARMTPSERLGIGAALWKAGDCLQQAVARRKSRDADKGDLAQSFPERAIQTVTSLADAFEPLRSALEKAGVRYAIGGSWASTAFGEPRFSNGVDILAELTEEKLRCFLRNLPKTFYADEEESLEAFRLGRPFNVLHMPMAFKFDFFSAAAFPLGRQELDRAISLAGTGLSETPAPFVTPEDILLAKLHWFQLRGERSEVQWRDVEGIVRGSAGTLDRGYLDENATKLGVSDLLAGCLLPATDAKSLSLALLSSNRRACERSPGF